MTRCTVSLYAQTVHRPFQRVNTLCQVTSEETPGSRLKAYIEAHWGRSRGGMERLATDAKLRGRQTLYEWFAGSEPSLASLGQVADALGVRRVDLVAAYDGVTAPQTEEAAPPRWAERPLALVNLLANRNGITEAEIAAEARRLADEAVEAPQRPEHAASERGAI